MAYQIEYAYTSHMGNVRGNNEDNFWCCGKMLAAENKGIPEVRNDSASYYDLPVLAVFDGMGGESCGEMAAYLAAEKLGDFYQSNRRSLKKYPGDFIDGACGEMNRAICHYGQENRISSMGTTMAMTIFSQEFIYACNLGDSRIYQFAGGKFQQISRDHVLGKSRFGKAPLTQYLGIEEEQMALEPSITKLEYLPDSRYLLCSDGVTDMLTDGELADLLSRESPVDVTTKLILELALKRGGRDNVTIILCEVQQQKSGNPVVEWMKHYRKKTMKVKNHEEPDAGSGL